MSAFLDCKIWDINRYPRYGSITKNLNKRTLSEIAHHNSLNTIDQYQSNNVSIQIPEFLIRATDDEKEFVYKYKERIIKMSLPIVVLNVTPDGEQWELDLKCAEHVKYLRN